MSIFNLIVIIVIIYCFICCKYNNDKKINKLLKLRKKDNYYITKHDLKDMNYNINRLQTENKYLKTEVYKLWDFLFKLNKKIEKIQIDKVNLDQLQNDLKEKVVSNTSNNKPVMKKIHSKWKVSESLIHRIILK